MSKAFTRSRESGYVPLLLRSSLIYLDPVSHGVVTRLEELSPAEADALGQYSIWSRDLNTALKDGILSTDQAELVAALDRATEKWELSTSTFLYHGTSADVLKRYEAGGYNPGFFSTTTRRTVALTHRSGNGGLLRIWCRTGTRLAHLDHPGLLSNNEDSELLLGRGAQFRILEPVTVQCPEPLPLEGADAQIPILDLELCGFVPALYAVES